MDALIVYPENKKQLAALKAVMRAMDVSFEQKSEIYPQHVLDGVIKSANQAREDLLTPYTGIKAMLNLE